MVGTYLTILDSSATSSDMWSARFTNSPGVCSTSGRRRYSVNALQTAMHRLRFRRLPGKAMLCALDVAGLQPHTVSCHFMGSGSCLLNTAAVQCS
jgi:hypothetical protein